MRSALRAVVLIASIGSALMPSKAAALYQTPESDSAVVLRVLNWDYCYFNVLDDAQSDMERQGDVTTVVDQYTLPQPLVAVQVVEAFQYSYGALAMATHGQRVRDCRR